MKPLIFALLALASLIAPAHAGEDALATRKTLESGQIAAGERAMAARLTADPKNNEARFGTRHDPLCARDRALRAEPVSLRAPPAA
jgi:hypothetical protein